MTRRSTRFNPIVNSLKFLTQYWIVTENLCIDTIVNTISFKKNPNYRDVAFVHTAIDCRVGLDFSNRCRRLCDNRHITNKHYTDFQKLYDMNKRVFYCRSGGGGCIGTRLQAQIKKIKWGHLLIFYYLVLCRSYFKCANTYWHDLFMELNLEKGSLSQYWNRIEQDFHV